MPIVVADIPWEKVAPVIFFALFYIAKVFMDRNQSDAPQVDPAEAERAKRLQEEIRRAIAERNRKYQEENAPRQAPTAPPPVPQSRPAPQPTVPVPPRRQLEGTNQPMPQRAMPQPVHRVQVTPVNPVSVADSTNADHGTIAGMQGSGLSTRQLFERQMAADYAAAYADTSSTITTPMKKSTSTFGQDIITNLTERDALRRAFVTAEILGPPVANKY